MQTGCRAVSLSALLLLVFASAVAVGSGAQAANNAPLGYQILCLQQPAECEGGGASTIAATESVLTTLNRVNSIVNKTITPRSDGSADIWRANAQAGDCEDYALAKRRALIDAGLPASALRLAYVKTRSGEGHAILVVKTTTADLVLDNLAQAVRPLAQTGYHILSMANANPRVWS